MRILRPSILIAIATALSLLQPSLAASAGVEQPPRIVPAHLADGLTARQLATQVGTQAYTTPTTAPPVDCHYFGATGQILAVSDTDTVCTTTYGEPLVALFLLGCDPIEAWPFHGVTAQQQRHCAKTWLRKHFTTFQLSVDGQPSVTSSNRDSSP